MIPPADWVRAALAGLALFEASLLGVRCFQARSRAELLSFALALLVVSGGAFLPSRDPVVGLYILAVLWVLGLYAACLAVTRRLWIWHCCVAAAVSVFLLLRAIGLGANLPFRLLFSFVFLLLYCYPGTLFFGVCRRIRHPLLYLYSGAVTVLSMTLVVDFVLRQPWQARLAGVLLYLTVAGFLLAEEAYLRGPGWQGLHLRIDAQERRLKQAYSRLIQTENTLLLQDRLAVTGLLAAGAAHEFKNVLTLIQTSAGFGLRQQERKEMHRALHSVLEQAALGQQAAMRFLDLLVQQGREQPGTVFLKDELEMLIKMVRASCRREGIHLSCDIPAELRVTVRKGELEQVLLNLLGNAMDSLRDRNRTAAGAIRLQAGVHEGKVVIDVADNGAGIPPELMGSIFEPEVSGKQSSGLGLFLARSLVERNGGIMEVVPSTRGGCLRIVFPCP